MDPMYELVLHVVSSDIHWKDGPQPGNPTVATILKPKKSANWIVQRAGERTEAPGPTFGNVHDVFESIGVFDKRKRLVDGNETGHYFIHWDISGRLEGKPFSFEVDFVAPGERWTEEGEKLRDLIERVLSPAQG